MRLVIYSLLVSILWVITISIYAVIVPSYERIVVEAGLYLPVISAWTINLSRIVSSMWYRIFPLIVSLLTLAVLLGYYKKRYLLFMLHAAVSLFLIAFAVVGLMLVTIAMQAASG